MKAGIWLNRMRSENGKINLKPQREAASMSYRVIYFGWNDCHRVQVLRSAGYEVEELASLGELGLYLEKNVPVDVVVVSESDQRSAEQAAELVRRHSKAPLILFRRDQNALDEGKFDQVFSSLVEPQVWLKETAALIEHGRIGQRNGRVPGGQQEDA
jgi:hypothetical protein